MFADFIKPSGTVSSNIRGPGASKKFDFSVIGQCYFTAKFACELFPRAAQSARRGLIYD